MNRPVIESIATLVHEMTHQWCYERGVKAQLRLRRPKIFVSGHSHILKVIYDRRNDWLHINPGAAGLSGFHQVRTAVRLTIDGADIRDLEVGEWPRRLKL